MADQLEEIKRKVDIVELINEYVPLKKTGRNFKALCPFHSETIPSFVVSPERQIWKCFGCGLGGDHFRFLMEREGMEFGEALRTLAKRAGVKLKPYKPSESEKAKQLLYEINHLASEFYHYLLINHPAGKKALNYILGRGISKESLQLFKLGFAPDLWEGLQKFLVGKKGYKPEDLEKAGLVIRSEKGRGYYDRFRGRLMFTLKDHRGNVVGFAGRVLDPKQEEVKYINTPETLVYHKSDLLYGLTETRQAIKKADEAILVEGELDLISSYQAGIKNVLAIKGSALTSSQVQLLGRYTKNLIFALDCDVAGDAAARRGIEIADAAGIAIKVVELKGGKDPDEVAQKNPKLWQKLVTKAVPVYDYFFASAFSRFDAKTAEGKRRIGQELAPVLAKISNEIVRGHYMTQLGEKLGVGEEAIAVEVAKMEVEKWPIPAQAPTEREVGEKLSRREILEEHLLALAFQANQWEFLRKRKVTSIVKTPRFARILEILAKYLKRYKSFESERLAKMLPAELVETFNKFYLLDFVGIVEEEEKLAKEFEKTLNQLEKFDLKEQLKEIANKIKAIEKKKEVTRKEKKQLKNLHQEFRDLSKKLAELEQEK